MTYPFVKGIQICFKEGPCYLPRRDDNEIAKIHWRNLDILYIISGSISTKHGTKHSLINGIIVFSLFFKWRAPAFSKRRKQNDENNLTKIFFSRRTESFTIKHDRKHSWMKGNNVCWTKEPRIFPEGRYYWNSDNNSRGRARFSTIW